MKFTKALLNFKQLKSIDNLLQTDTERPLIANRVKNLHVKSEGGGGIESSFMSAELSVLLLFLQLFLGRNAFENYYDYLVLQQNHIQSCGHRLHFWVQRQMFHPAHYLVFTGVQLFSCCGCSSLLSSLSPHFWIFKLNHIPK